METTAVSPALERFLTDSPLVKAFERQSKETRQARITALLAEQREVRAARERTVGAARDATAAAGARVRACREVLHEAEAEQLRVSAIERRLRLEHDQRLAVLEGELRELAEPDTRAFCAALDGLWAQVTREPAQVLSRERWQNIHGEAFLVKTNQTQREAVVGEILRVRRAAQELWIEGLGPDALRARHRAMREQLDRHARERGLSLAWPDGVPR